MAQYIGDLGIIFAIILVVMYTMWDELFPR
ncbi:MAG: hypothetical protein H6Q73_1373 [Firmicutes bacterium]|nr:hypothetical protein [Bacillota bacterium]